MNKLSISLIVAMIVVAAAGIVLLLLPEKDPDNAWVGRDEGQAEPTSLPVDVATPSPPEIGPATGSGNRTSTGTPSTRPPAGDTPQMQAWEAAISDALSDDSISNSEAAKRLLALAYDDKVDEQIRLDALEHSLNLSEDGEFGQILPLLTDKSAPVEMLDSILTDLYNRGDRVKLESVLEVAKVPDHPLRDDAIELLEFYVDENYGNDWNAWSAALNTYFTENDVE